MSFYSSIATSGRRLVEEEVDPAATEAVDDTGLRVPLERDPDAFNTFGGGLFEPIQHLVERLSRCARELNDEECSLAVCGLLCAPCVIGEAVEQAGEGNFWVHCTAVLLAPHLALVPYCLFTVPALNRISQRLGGDEQWTRHLACLAVCRPCTACQLHRAVKEGRAQGKLGGSSSSTGTTQQHTGAPVSQSME